MCAQDLKLNEQLDQLALIYNPSLEIQDYIVSNFVTSKGIKVKHWDKFVKKFVDAESEAFCYSNPDNDIECEVYAYVQVPPLSYEVVKY